jgi:DNA-3-methyladenine glycosylase I
MSPNQITRCAWARNEFSIQYHDEEWGIPVHDDRIWFEFLILEGAQAGLSWDTILRKRKAYRVAFDNFDPAKIARYNQRKLESLMKNDGIIRNRLKIASAVSNARAFMDVQEEFGNFDKYIWQFVDGKPKVNYPRMLKDIPARSLESDEMSKALRKRGFKFVGSTICYAFMQATGLVDDHEISCFRKVNGRKPR